VVPDHGEVLVFFLGIVLPLVLLAAAGVGAASAVVRWEARLTGEPEPDDPLASWTSQRAGSRTGTGRLRLPWPRRRSAGAVEHQGAPS
jgi:hypothetical protein